MSASFIIRAAHVQKELLAVAKVGLEQVSIAVDLLAGMRSVPNEVMARSINAKAKLEAAIAKAGGQ